MRRIIISILFLFGVLGLQAQFSAGVRQGYGSHGISLWPSTMDKYQVPFLLPNTGLVIIYNSISNSGLQLEINHAIKGWHEEDTTIAGSNFKKKLTYIEVPLYSHWEIGRGKLRGIIIAGPYLAWKLSESTDSVNFSHIWNDSHPYNHYEQETKNLDFGIKFGLGLKYNITSRLGIFIDARYDVDVAGGSDIFIDRPNDIQTSRLQEISGSFGVLWNIIMQEKPSHKDIYHPKEDLYN